MREGIRTSLPGKKEEINPVRTGKGGEKRRKESTETSTKRCSLLKAIGCTTILNISSRLGPEI